MKELLALLCESLEQGKPVALAGVTARQGSTPREAGSRLLANAEGLLAGTVGGGLAEGLTLQACAEALADSNARILNVTMTGELAALSEMICGGALRILVEPLTPGDRDFFCALRDAVNSTGAVLITDITNPARPVRTAWTGEAAFGAPLPPEILNRLLETVRPPKENADTTIDGREYIVARCLPPERMIIAGGGHVSRPTAQVAALAGFSVTVLDDRPEFSQPERFPWAERVLTTPEYTDCFARLTPDSRTYIVIVTRGHLHDAAVLAQALATKAGYIGMIGSKRKREEVYASLRARGMPDEELARVHCPVGLSIHAETPEEIAVSIVAECIAHRRQPCPPQLAQR